MNAYLFTHFMYNTPGPSLEQIQFSVSRDGLNWKVLNNSLPVLENHGNDGGLRDPFIYRKKDGTFVILATDLNIARRNDDWANAVNHGSKDIILFESADLVHWSEPKAIPMPLPDATCAWAPEVIDDQGKPLVIWSARLNGKTKVYAAHTEDFVNYEKPFIFAEAEMDVIDTTVCPYKGVYYRFTKDEKAQAVLMESSASLTGPWQAVPGYNLGDLRGVEGPICTFLPDGRALLLLDFYGGGKDASYIAFTSSDLSQGNFISAKHEYSTDCRLKHGTIMPITEFEYERLVSHAWK